ncbi:hypothetical protein M422DRAFT_151545 [Sphaerobolus stellatus SS14]|nr:hypothetical protein M422DRAFT_151545 [Sphaerobolus stellatus SS14]
MSYHVFSLPPDLLEHITLRTLFNAPPEREPSPIPEPASKVTPSILASSKSCNICLGATFTNVDDQRAHFRSDWHRYNVRLRLRGEDVVNEQQFASLVERLEDSLSGSASSSEDESDDTPDTVRTLLAKSKLADRSDSPTSERRPARTPIIWFHSPPSTQIGVYNALFPLSLPQDEYVPVLKELQYGGTSGRIWTMFMVAGGHFAGLVVQVRRPDEDEEEVVSGGKKKKKQKPKPEFEILKHKTFHRYTTRRKQGGSQSVNDNAKGHAKSAGAQLRRYGEQALRDDIRNLLAEWADDVAASELIWMRASVSNKRIFYDYDEAVFAKGDDRLRTFPFPTRRPTQSELMRCLTELTRVKVSHLTEDALRAQDEEYLASLPKPKPVPTPAPVPAPSSKPVIPKLSKEEEVRREKWSRLVDMVTRGRVEVFRDLWQREGDNLGGINVRVPEREATLLHISAKAGQEEMTRFLLEELHADPTIPVGVEDEQDEAGAMSDASDAPPPASTYSRRVAYDLAKSRGVRNVFRRCAGAHPDWWDWLGAARIPSVLNEEKEKELEERKKNRRKGLKEKLRERQAKQEETASPPTPEPAPIPTPRKPVNEDGPRKLGGHAGAQESLAGLTPEMRAKIERERRARAAEARLKMLGSG